MAASYHMAAILFVMLVFNMAAGCDVNDVAVYKVMMKMMWSEERFPKDYPQNRPKAQWSQVFGQSHNASYNLYHVGDVAKPSVRYFSQFGKIDDLVKEGDEIAAVYDQFFAPALVAGVGETENMVFVDGEHSLISLISHLIPSPDWFIGVDSVNLCVDSSWIDQITLDLEPLDAGAASGLTFTAPRWETSPPEPVQKHQPRSPDHPAAGFYYPDLRQLPAIAQVEIVKIKQYSNKELNELARKEVMAMLKLKNEHKGLPKKAVVNTEELDPEEDIPVQSEVTTKNAVETLKDLEEEPVGTPSPYFQAKDVVVVTKPPTTTTTEKEFDEELRSMDDVVLAVANGRRMGLNKHLPRHFRSRLHHAVNRIQPNDCLVSEWSAWSPCSVTCGFGNSFRHRTVVREKKDGGRKCPGLTDRRRCAGKVKTCSHVDYFEW